MRVLVSGGGTAGHIYPALTVAAQLVAGHSQVTFVGTPTGLESRLVVEANVPFRPLAATGFDRARPWTLVTSSLRIMASAIRAWRWMGHERPDVVIGFGGYVSIPVGLAAALRRVPLVLHEQNSVPGLANRILSRWAAAVGVTYEQSAAAFVHPERVVRTGNPVRSAVLDADALRGRAALGLPADAVVLLVFGGSRGARHLNSAMLQLMPRLCRIDGLHVVLIAGRAEYESVCAAVEGAAASDSGCLIVLDYFDDMGSAIAASDLVVARAGATSIAELTALGAPCVLVPYPYATDDHQTKNARAMADCGAAIVVPDAAIDSQRFGDELIALLGDGGRRASMAAASRALGRPDAASRVEQLAREAAGARA